MAERRYGNAGITVDTGSNTADTLMQMMQMHQQNKRTEARDAREESRFIMEEANAKWNKDIKEKQFNSEQSFNKWTAEGWDNSLIGQEDPRGLFGASLPNYGAQWAGYYNEQQAMGLNPKEESFRTAIKEKNNSYMQSTAARFNAVYSTIAANNPGFDEDDLNKHMQDNYDARNVYNNYVRQFGVEQANLNLGGYKPVGEKRGFGDRLMSPFVDPEITSTIGGQEVTSGGGVDALGVGTATAVVGGGIGGGYMAKGQYDEAMKLYTDTYDKDVLNKKGGGLDFKKFKEKYGVTKKAAQGKSSGEILKLAKDAGYKGTWASRLADKTRGKSYLKYGIGGATGSKIGGAIGEVVGGEGGEVAGQIGGQIGGMAIMKKLSNPKTMKALKPLLKKYAPKLALKLGASMAGYMGPQAAEPISTALGLAGTAWAVKDLYDLAQEVPEIYKILAGD